MIFTVLLHLHISAYFATSDPLSKVSNFMHYNNPCSKCSTLLVSLSNLNTILCILDRASLW